MCTSYDNLKRDIEIVSPLAFFLQFLLWKMAHLHTYIFGAISDYSLFSIADFELYSLFSKVCHGPLYYTYIYISIMYIRRRAAFHFLV